MPCLITNKHMVGGLQQISATVHLSVSGKPSGEFAECRLDIRPENVIAHPDSQVDLCALPFGPILNEAQQNGRSIFYVPLNIDLVPAEDDWDFFDAIEEVVMIGCPNGISDEFNKLPIVRRGITATSLGKRYNGKDEFMVDMACFPGSSGSPILIYNSSGYLDRRKNAYMAISSRLLLVGVLYAGPQINTTGQIVFANSPSFSVANMMHLGNAIRASRLRELEIEAVRLFGLRHSI